MLMKQQTSNMSQSNIYKQPPNRTSPLLGAQEKDRKPIKKLIILARIANVVKTAVMLLNITLKLPIKLPPFLLPVLMSVLHNHSPPTIPSKSAYGPNPTEARGLLVLCPALPLAYARNHRLCPLVQRVMHMLYYIITSVTYVIT